MAGEFRDGDWTKSSIERIKFIFRSNQLLTFPNKITNVLEEISKKFHGLPKEPTATTLRDQKEKVLALWKEKRSLEGLDNRTLRNIPWFLFLDEDPLGAKIDFAEVYGNWLKHHQKPLAIKALLTVLLRDYPERLPTFQYWKEILKAVLKEAKRKDLTIWYDRCTRFFLLEDDGTRRFANLFLNSSKSFDELLKESGLVNILETSKFLSMIILQLLDSFGEFLRDYKPTEEGIIRFLNIFIDHGGQLRFKEHRIKIINSLLTPLADPHIENRVLNTVCEFLRKLFGDPRLDRTSWYGVDEKAKQVMLRWLTGETLEFFFKIIDRTVESSEYRHHWPYRKAFWYAYYRKGFISEAWVVLGERALSEVKQIEGWRYNSHGRLLKEANVLKDHSVLILKFVDGLIVAEWSHNGKGRIWRRDNENSPKLYKSEYSRRELINGDFQFVHSYSENYSWQKKVRNHIKTESGIFVSDEDIKV